jgi:hypothetical protein
VKVYLVVDKDGEEMLTERFPERRRLDWRTNGGYVILPDGFAKRLTGKNVTWEDEPIDITENSVSAATAIYQVYQCNNMSHEDHKEYLLDSYFSKDEAEKSKALAEGIFEQTKEEWNFDTFEVRTIFVK